MAAAANSFNSHFGRINFSLIPQTVNGGKLTALTLHYLGKMFLMLSVCICKCYILHFTKKVKPFWGSVDILKGPRNWKGQLEGKDRFQGEDRDLVLTITVRELQGVCPHRYKCTRNKNIKRRQICHKTWKKWPEL